MANAIGGESLFNEAKQCLIDKMQPSLQETRQLLYCKFNYIYCHFKWNLNFNRSDERDSINLICLMTNFQYDIFHLLQEIKK